MSAVHRVDLPPRLEPAECECECECECRGAGGSEIHGKPGIATTTHLVRPTLTISGIRVPSQLWKLPSRLSFDGVLGSWDTLVSRAVLDAALCVAVAAPQRSRRWIAACLSAHHVALASLSVSGIECGCDTVRCQQADAAGQPALSHSFSIRWQLRHQSSACLATSVNPLQDGVAAARDRCASSQRLEALGACLCSMMCTTVCRYGFIPRL